MSRTVTIGVPASTSNLGAGFDCVGVAVDRWLNVSATLDGAGRGFTIVRRGTLSSLTIDAEDDRLVAGFRAACRRGRRELLEGAAFQATSNIPIGRGLGSSASATLAGALAANALLGLGLTDRAIASACAEVEGHPDNVVPALFGGARLALTGADGSLLVSPLHVHESLALVFAIPEFALETSHARAVLPLTVAHSTATRAAALGAALVQGLASGNGGLLAAALSDVLHVPFRRGLIEGFDAVTRAARRGGAYGATLSGSGSTIVAIAPAADAPDVAAQMVAAWKALRVEAESLVNPASVGGATVRAGDVQRPQATSSARGREIIASA
jgi:homoserine kinase